MAVRGAPAGAGELPPGALDPLPAGWYLQPLLEIAPGLLGRLLVHDAPEGLAAVRIVEVEAYGGVGEDPASHAHRGRTPRNAPMFGPGGRLYVYCSYGMHWCTNVVCGPPGTAAAVLLRAGEPVLGEELMLARHLAARRAGRRPTRRDLARGPGRLSRALGLAGWANGADLARGPVRLTAGWPASAGEVAWTPRIGISAATDRPWRALIAGSPYVSRRALPARWP